MQDLIKLIGHEFSIKKLSRELWYWVKELRPTHVGAMHITCADETEYECTQAFQQGFVQHFLPQLKFAHQAPFRISNLGGRYEKGALAIAENHFCPKRDPRTTANDFTIMVIKVNSHVGTVSESNEDGYGFIERYGQRSTCCGALTALLNSTPQMRQEGFLGDLAAVFRGAGNNALQFLSDPKSVQPQYRSLFAAVLSALLQADRVIDEIQHTRHPGTGVSASSPVLHLVVPCVTLNRPETDTEILCGLYKSDNRSQSDKLKNNGYMGLGKDPAKYNASIQKRRLVITDQITEID